MDTRSIISILIIQNFVSSSWFPKHPLSTTLQQRSFLVRFSSTFVVNDGAIERRRGKSCPPFCWCSLLLVLPFASAPFCQCYYCRDFRIYLSSIEQSQCFIFVYITLLSKYAKGFLLHGTGYWAHLSGIDFVIFEIINIVKGFEICTSFIGLLLH